MKKIYVLTLLAAFSVCPINAQEDLNVPSFEEVISLKRTGSPVISPDGQDVLFTIRQTDWEKNQYDTEIWLSKGGAEAFQLTNNPTSSSSNPKWSPDGKWIAFTSNRGNKNQIYVIQKDGGEAFQLTAEEDGIINFEWAPNSKVIAFMLLAEEKENEKTKKDRYGGYAIEDQEYRLTRLRTIDFDPNYLELFPLPSYKSDSTNEVKDCVKRLESRPLIDSVDFTITQYQWSPDGKMIAFTHQPDPLMNSSVNADISLVTVETKEITSVIQNPGFDGLIGWSPNSKTLLYSSAVGNTTSNYYMNNRYFRIDIDGSNKKELARDFDENLRGLTWTEKGIYCTGSQKTKSHLFLLDPDTGEVNPILTSPARIYTFSTTKAGDKVAFTGFNDDSLNEIYITDLPDNKAKKISSFSSQIKNWKYSLPEVISWESKDGAIIEGVLHKPMDYDPNKVYPLMVVIHGGPTGISVPNPVPPSVYPVLQWLDKGALVLEPNYRGSAGYGEDFRKLNVENLGVGDAWDVISGIEYLDSKNMIDMDKLGAMGWSQGGYISAFLTTNTDIFKAISVGAGISNWVTYYVNTDIHPFTRQYLKATPWENEEVYRKTSPMTNINNAKTPTLIQHGEFDRRVPIPNAYELFQGLQDVGVDSKLIVYKGFGHGISKPKERLAATWHNWQWFGKYIWGEDIELPVE